MHRERENSLEWSFSIANHRPGLSTEENAALREKDLQSVISILEAACL
jgi:hypothetical protein